MCTCSALSRDSLVGLIFSVVLIDDDDDDDDRFDIALFSSGADSVRSCRL